MKVLHLSLDHFSGGASIAANRLHNAMVNNGYESFFYVKHKQGNDTHLIEANPQYNTKCIPNFNEFIKKLALKIKYKRLKFANANWSNPHLVYGNYVVERYKNLDFKKFDIFNLHWISNFIDIGWFFKNISKDQVVVWTLHDTFAITGGCHYFRNCNNYINNCGSCYQIESSKNNDVTKKNLQEKKNIYSYSNLKNLSFVSPSEWLHDKVQKSSITRGFPSYVINNGVDENVYKPMNKDILRKIYNIPKNKKVILHIIKGEDTAIRFLEDLKEKSEYLVISIGKFSNSISKIIEYRYFGHIDDDRQKAIIYNLADIFLLPSDIDNFPNTILESFSCGTPVIASNVGGIPETVIDGLTGFLFDNHSSSQGNYILDKYFGSNINMQKSMQSNCRKLIQKNLTLDIQVKNYINLYHKLLIK